jgi:LysR family glycine cleavage system transcriptional activator
MRMAERIPHLTALRAFETAARHLSFRAAAHELGLSPSAVSHQIRSLENYLEVRLFDRLTRAIALTEAGEALRPGVEDGFRRIEDAVRQVRSLKTHAVIVISAGPAIAAKWLVPRLYHFEERYPAIEIRITTSSRMIDLEREDIDVAIRYGLGKYEGLETTRLFGEAYVPMCSPGLLSSRPKPLRKPADLAHHRLLHVDAAPFPGPTPGWPEWLKAEKVRKVDGMVGRHFAQSDHAMQAAIDGAGVLLGRVAIASADLAAGRLVRPFDKEMPSDFGYFFVTRKGRLREKPIAALLQWIKEEARSIDFLPA